MGALFPLPSFTVLQCEGASQVSLNHRLGRNLNESME